jgi:cob(I)alamin adenosyltransferase
VEAVGKLFCLPPSQETYLGYDDKAFCVERKECDSVPFNSGWKSVASFEELASFSFVWRRRKAAVALLRRTDTMSITTKRRDGGQTGLAGGIRVSKSSLRVETYGTIDELIAALGFARSICADEDIRTRTKLIQRELFQIGSALATPPESRKPQVPVPETMVEELTKQVHEIEALKGVAADWTLAGEHPAGAAYDMARTICRRAERIAVRLAESGEVFDPNVLAYLNRLSDLLWLLGRKLEFDAGVSGSLREMSGRSGPPWSRAW